MKIKLIQKFGSNPIHWIHDEHIFKKDRFSQYTVWRHMILLSDLWFNIYLSSSLSSPQMEVVVEAPLIHLLTITNFLSQLCAALCHLAKDRPVHFPDVIFPPLLSTAFSCSRHHALKDKMVVWVLSHINLWLFNAKPIFMQIALKDSFCQVWSCHVSIPHNFSFLHDAKVFVMWPRDYSYSFFDLLICDVVSVWDVQKPSVAF